MTLNTCVSVTDMNMTLNTCVSVTDTNKLWFYTENVTYMMLMTSK